MVKAGGIPVMLKETVDVLSGTPISVEVSGQTGVFATADSISIDYINNDKNNFYYKKGV